jgi:5S rRNA maturation endonuclease (ribonuclease M5)
MSDWFQDVSELIKQVEILYTGPAVKLGVSDKISLTKKKVIAERQWEPCLHLIERNFDDQLTRINLFYIPKTFQPGPCFVFPLVDAIGFPVRARVRPMEGSELFGQGKYVDLGDKSQFVGPPWIGNDGETLRKIIETQSVILVEGGFDLLACRLLAPELPMLSPLTAGLGKKHVLYLRILGVRNVYLLFDNDKKGTETMDQIQYFSKEFDSVQQLLLTGAADPSAALKTTKSARLLRDLLYRNFPGL